MCCESQRRKRIDDALWLRPTSLRTCRSCLLPPALCGGRSSWWSTNVHTRWTRQLNNSALSANTKWPAPATTYTYNHANKYKQPMGCEAQLARKCLFMSTSLIRGDLTSKVPQIGTRTNIWFLVWDQSSLVGLCMQDYKSLCAAVTICATMVNIQMDRHTQIAFWSALTAYMKSSESWAKTVIIIIIISR